MAGNSVIGALRVDLGLNSAQFSLGLKQAQGALGKFGVQLTLGLETVANAVGRVIGAMPAAIKGAIDHADALNKSAQKAGVTVEALSRLEYAAKLSDVSLEGLTGGLGKLSKAMAEATANKTSTAATAFRALGISVTDASGKLRSSSAVLGEIADRFSRLPDSATKTALAMQLFGKSGAELIPLLNGGADGLKRMAEESDRVGATISTKTAQAAEKFNDTLTRIGEIMGGVVNKVMEAALPALQSLADTLASPEFAAAAQAMASGIITAVDTIVNAFVNAINFVKSLGSAMEDLAAKQARKPTARPGTIEYNQQMQAIDKSDAIGKGADWSDLSSMVPVSLKTTKTPGTTPPPFKVPTFDTGGAVKSLRPLHAAITDTRTDIDLMNEAIGNQASGAFTSFADAVMSGVAPMKALTDTIGDLSKKLVNKGIEMLFNGLFSSTLSGGAFMPKGGFIPGLTGPKLFASGGIASSPSIFGDAGPEAAVPLPDGRSIPVTLSGNGGGITINNYGARIEQRQGPSGPELDVFVDQSVARNLSRAGTKASRTMRTVYGNAQQLTRR